MGQVRWCVHDCVSVNVCVSAVQTLREAIAMGTTSLSHWDSRSSAECVHFSMCVRACLCVFVQDGQRGRVNMHEGEGKKEALNSKRGRDVEDMEKRQMECGPEIWLE